MGSNEEKRATDVGEDEEAGRASCRRIQLLLNDGCVYVVGQE